VRGDEGVRVKDERSERMMKGEGNKVSVIVRGEG